GHAASPNGNGAARREATVFGRSKAAVERLTHWLREESPDDALTVVLTSRPERPLRVETAVGKMDPNALAAELDSLAPSSRSGNMPAALESVRQILESKQGHVNATVYIVSDFQRADWGREGGVSTQAGPG